MAWITLNELKTHLHIGVSESDFDTQLTDLIAECQADLEAYLGQKLDSRSVTEYYDGDNTNILVLRQFPVISITSIYIDPDREWTSDTLANSADYYVDNDSAIIEFWDANGPGPIFFEPGIKNIRVIYTAGFATIPSEAKLALKQFAAWAFRRSATEGSKSEALASKSEQFDDSKFPEWIKRRLDRFKVHQC